MTTDYCDIRPIYTQVMFVFRQYSVLEYKFSPLLSLVEPLHVVGTHLFDRARFNFFTISPGLRPPQDF